MVWALPTGARLDRRGVPTLGGHPRTGLSPSRPISPLPTWGQVSGRAQRHGCDRPVLSRVDPRSRPAEGSDPGRPVDPSRQAPQLLLEEAGPPSCSPKVRTWFAARVTRKVAGDGLIHAEPQAEGTVLAGRAAPAYDPSPARGPALRCPELGPRRQGPRRRLGVASPVSGDRAEAVRYPSIVPVPRSGRPCAASSRGDQDVASLMGPGRKAPTAATPEVSSKAV